MMPLKASRATTMLVRPIRPSNIIVALVLFGTVSAAYAQTDPWSSAATRLATAFTGPIAKGFALVATVIGGLHLAFSEGQGKKMVGGLIFGLGLALGAANFIAWLFG